MSTIEERPAPTPPDPSTIGRRGDPDAWWRGWRWILLGAVVAAQLAGVLSSPVRASVDDFFADLAAGRVQSLDPGSYPEEPPVGFVIRPNDGDGPFTSPAGVRWVGRFGFVYQADLVHMPSGESDAAIEPDDADVERTVAAMARLTGQGLPRTNSSLNAAGAPLLLGPSSP